MDDACGPESLAFAIRRDRRGSNLKRLAAQCRIKRDSGALTASMVATLVERGYKPWVETDTTWERVGELLPKHHVFISWWTLFFPSGETGDGAGAHWSVVTKLGPVKVYLWDPTYEQVVAYPRATLDALWVTPERIGKVLHDEVRLAVVAPRRPLGRKKPQKPA